MKKLLFLFVTIFLALSIVTSANARLRATSGGAEVTLAGVLDYITIAGQVITRNAIDLTTDIIGNLPILNGGTGSSTASGARTNLGLAIGSDVQAFDEVLDDLAALAVIADNQFIVGTGVGTYANESGATVRTSLGLTIGTDIQAFDTNLEDIAALAIVADNEVMIGTGAGTYSFESDATLRTSLGVDAAGTDNSIDVIIAAGLDYITISGQELTLGSVDLTTDVIGDLPVADGGTGASTAAAARTNLDVDQAGTDNSTDVTLAGTPDYITISGQIITRNAIDLAADVTGNLPVTNLNSGTGANATTFWRGDNTWVTPDGDAVDSVFGRTDAVVAAASDYDAVQVDNTPAGDIAATNVQAAIDELDSEKITTVGLTTQVTHNIGGVLVGDADLTFDGSQLAIGGGTPTTTFDVTGDMELTHTALATGDMAINLVTSAAGFGDYDAIDIDYTTGAIGPGDDNIAISIAIDESAATGGSVAGIAVGTTGVGSSNVYGLAADAEVGPVLKLIGAEGDMDSALVLAVDRLTEFTSTGSDIVMFVADNDTITIGNAVKFTKITFTLDTVSTGAGIVPTFEFSTGVGTFSTFTPVDGTNGMRQNGTIIWLITDISSWAVGTGSEFLIRITRTQDGLSTPPIEDLVQISSLQQFEWDVDGRVRAVSIATNQGLSDTMLLEAYDVDGAAYTVFGTLTANNTPTFDLSSTVTFGGALPYTIGGTDVTVTDGGTGSSTAGGARTNLGLVIGTDVQAFTTVLQNTTASFLTADETKLDGIETAATNGLKLLATATASASTSIDFTSDIDSTFDEYELHIINAVPATDAVKLFMRTSTDGGSSFDSGASDYISLYDNIFSDGTTLTRSFAGATTFEISNNVGNAAGESVNSVIKLYNPAATTHTWIEFDTVYTDPDPRAAIADGGGYRDSAADVDAIRFLFSSGNITSGEFKLYGVRK